MGRRGQECRCCSGCSDCEQTPTLVKATINYPTPANGAEIVAADDNDPPAWTSVSTTCGVPLERIQVRGLLFITDPGQQYTSPPMISLNGAAEGFGQSVTIQSPVESVTVAQGGSGYKTAPTVSFSIPAGGGRITAASAIARVEGTVATLTLTNPGNGYSSPPQVTFAGGNGATASVVMNGSAVESISLITGGSGYPPNPSVTISGGGGSGATATATILGSVVAVDVLNPGLYVNTNQHNGGPSYPDWPTISMSGGGGSGAQAVPVFSGSVRTATVSAAGYATPPQVVFSGGGGNGAAALAELEWERSHVLRQPFNSNVACFTVRSSSVGNRPPWLPVYMFCLDGTADVLPPAPSFSCLDNAELSGWLFQVVTSSSGTVLREDSAFPKLIYFPGEAIRAAVQRSWSAPNESAETNQIVYSQVDTHYTMPFFSRVEPVVIYRIEGASELPENNVTLTPTFRQYADGAGEPYWYLEALAITNAGQNLKIAPGATLCNLVADGNSRHVVTQASFTVTRTDPIATVPSLDGWNVQPEIAVTINPSGSAGYFFVASVAVESGGQTDQKDGQISIDLQLTAGHFVDGGRVQLTGTIVNGSLANVTISSSSLIIGPSTLTSIELPPDPSFNSPSRRTTGESLFKTTRTHTQPTVTATVGSVSLGVSLAAATDLNGEQYWYVASLSGDVTAGQAGSVLFEVESPGVEASPAIAFAFFDLNTNEQVKLIYSGGKYFIRQTSPTSDPLPPISCIGQITAENGWKVNHQELIGNFASFSVGQTFQATYQHVAGPGIPSTFPEVTRTRRCGLPTISLELE